MAHFVPSWARGIALVSFFYSNLTSAACFVRGEASIRGHSGFGVLSTAAIAESEVIWDEVEWRAYEGEQLSTQLGRIEGTDLIYSGPATAGFLLFGPYEDISVGGSRSAVQASIQISMDWVPDGREICAESHWVWKFPKREKECKRREWETFPSSFTIDIASQGGSRLHYQKTFENIHRLDYRMIDLPKLECEEPIKGLEVRIRDLQGGQGTIIVHKLLIDKFSAY